MDATISCYSLLAPIQDSTLIQGITILDLSRNLPGPAYSLMLMEMGAKMVKIEPPQGDEAKVMPLLYQALNGAKEIVAADFRTPEGVVSLKSHAKKADVLIEGFRPGAMAQMGCGFEALRESNPRLVVCSITGYGQQGKNAHRAGHDINFLAESGLLERLQTPSGELAMPGFQMPQQRSGKKCAN